MNPKRHLTAITRTDATEVARLTVETDVLFAIYQRALTDWLDKREELKDAERDAQNATELVDEVRRAERVAS